MKYVHFSDSEKLPAFPDITHFKCLVVIENKVDSEAQERISRWLVNSGCLYMMAWGFECSSWDDSVDIASLEEFEGEAISNEEIVLTTWHEKETLEEAVWFAKNVASNKSHDLDMVVFHIGGQSREKEFEAMFDAA